MRQTGPEHGAERLCGRRVGQRVCAAVIIVGMHDWIALKERIRGWGRELGFGAVGMGGLLASRREVLVERVRAQVEVARSFYARKHARAIAAMHCFVPVYSPACAYSTWVSAPVWSLHRPAC